MKVSVPGSADPLRSLAFSFSNDVWNAQLVDRLKTKLDDQHNTQNTAALFFGSGGLPYLLSMLRSETIVLADRSEDVIRMTRARVELLQQCDDWESYHAAVKTTLAPEERLAYETEIDTAERSGLQGDFETAKERGSRSEIVEFPGDMRDTVAKIGSWALSRQLRFGAINVSNIVNYLDCGSWGANVQAMGELLGQLPLLSDGDNTVVIDSSQILRPVAYTYDEYAMLGRPQDST